MKNEMKKNDIHKDNVSPSSPNSNKFYVNATTDNPILVRKLYLSYVDIDKQSTLTSGCTWHEICTLFKTIMPDQDLYSILQTNYQNDINNNSNVNVNVNANLNANVNALVQC